MASKDLPVAGFKGLRFLGLRVWDLGLGGFGIRVHKARV